jgi:uncharacterized membrane protein YciS (DUF1049 family)
MQPLLLALAFNIESEIAWLALRFIISVLSAKNSFLRVKVSASEATAQLNANKEQVREIRIVLFIETSG